MALYGVSLAKLRLATVLFRKCNVPCGLSPSSLVIGWRLWLRLVRSIIRKTSVINAVPVLMQMPRCEAQGNKDSE